MPGRRNIERRAAERFIVHRVAAKVKQRRLRPIRKKCRASSERNPSGHSALQKFVNGAGRGDDWPGRNGQKNGEDNRFDYKFEVIFPGKKIPD